MNYIKRFVVAAIVLLAFLAIQIPQSAHAFSYWVRSDGFESNPQATWSCWQATPSGIPCKFYTSTSAHQGSGSVIVSAGFASNAGGWSDVGKSFTIDTAIWQLHKPLHCQASFYLRNLSGDYYYPDGTYDLSGRIEVIDLPTWTYIATKDYSVLDQTNYVKVITDSWSPPS